MLMRPEGVELRRLAELAGRWFHAPVAYAAMLGHRDRVMSRFGSGDSYWRYLRTFPLSLVLSAPMVVRDARKGLPEGTDLEDLQFLASAPINTYCGQHLGVLVIADRAARPEFSQRDLDALAELADVMADRIELRMLAAQVLEYEALCDEAEERFRRTANCALELIVCNQADGSCEFVNNAWLKFTGRPIQGELGDGWQQGVHHDYRERFLSLYWEALQTSQHFSLRLPLLRHDGVYRWMHVNGTPRFLKDATFAGFVVYLTDLSDYSEEAAVGQ
jgi:PAS domain S-box-containing protein